MTHKIFSVYDSKALLFQTPFTAPAAGVAIRAFEQAAQTEGNDFNKFAADFTLFEIGTFNVNDGIIMPHAAHINLGCAITFINSISADINPDYAAGLAELKEA